MSSLLGILAEKHNCKERSPIVAVRLTFFTEVDDATSTQASKIQNLAAKFVEYIERQAGAAGWDADQTPKVSLGYSRPDYKPPAHVIRPDRSLGGTPSEKTASS